MEISLSKAMADLESMIELYGREAVLDALAEIAGEDNEVINEVSMKGTVAKQVATTLFNLIVKAAGGTAKVAAKPIASAVGKALDQDVRISSQGPILKVTDPGLYDLITQTNNLIKKTNELLASASSTIEASNKELGNIDDDFDDLLSMGMPGQSATDVKVRQAAGLSPEVPMPSEEEPEEERI